MSTIRAIVIGQLVVNLPVYAMITVGGIVGYARGSLMALWLGVIVGTVPAWLWWSITVPRWRAWALARGTDPEQLQRVGVMTGLLWPKGWIFEKTELPPRS